MKWFYEILYGRLRAPWDIGARKELVELVECGRIKPCRAIDLGSGTASNCIFLAQRGFDVTGVDFAASAIELGRKRARAANVNVNFIVDDLTNLQHTRGTFDLLVDYGTLDDLTPANRDLYLQNVLPHTHPKSQFVLYCFEWTPRWWEQPFFHNMACEPGEIARRKMKTWFTSLNGAITLSAIASRTELWRAFVDFQHEYSGFLSGTGAVLLGTLLYTAFFGGWAWALLGAMIDNRVDHQRAVSARDPHWDIGRLLPFAMSHTLAHHGTSELDQPTLRATGWRCARVATHKTRRRANAARVMLKA